MISSAILALALMGQDTVSVVQVGTGEVEDRDTPMEQLSEPGETVIDTQPRDDETAPDMVAQLSDSDTEVEFAKVEGIDRCSAELLSASDAEYCARRLETRSDEFSTDNEAPLTAEQVLIGERFASMADGDVAGRSRTAGRGDISAEDRELQALASITLGAEAPVTDPAKPVDTDGFPPETQALIEAIVKQIGGPAGDGG